MKNAIFTVVALAAAVTVGGFLLVGGDEGTPNFSGVLPAPSTTVEPTATAHKVKEERPQLSETGPWPKAVVEETEFYFGNMTVGTKQDHKFTIQNAGEADLVLLAGQPTCKCTAFELSSTTVKPGESAELLVQWHGKLQDPSFQHGGSIYTNDPKRDELRFSVKGIVDASIEVLPNEIWNVGEVTAAAPGTMDVVVLSRVHEQFSVSSIECDSPFIQTSVTPMPDERLAEYKALRAYLIKLTVSPEMPPGLLEEPLTLTVDCEKSPISIKVTAHKLGPIRVLPTSGVIWVESSNRLVLGQFSTAKGREIELTLLVDEQNATEPLKITSVDATPSFIGAELHPVGKVAGGKSRYTLKVMIPPGIPRSERGSDSRGRILIETNHPSGQSLQINATYKSVLNRECSS